MGEMAISDDAYAYAHASDALSKTGQLERRIAVLETRIQILEEKLRMGAVIINALDKPTEGR